MEMSDLGHKLTSADGPLYVSCAPIAGEFSPKDRARLICRARDQLCRHPESSGIFQFQGKNRSLIREDDA